MHWIHHTVRAVLVSCGYGAILAGLLGENAGLPFDSPIPTPRRMAFKSAIALFLTFAAGYVDVVGLLTVYRMFTAHMTGTTVHLGELIIQRNWKAALIAATIVAVFFLGSVAGRMRIEVGARLAFRRIASITLTLELCCWPRPVGGAGGFYPGGKPLPTRRG